MGRDHERWWSVGPHEHRPVEIKRPQRKPRLPRGRGCLREFPGISSLGQPVPSQAGGLRHGGRTEELYVHHDRCHNAISLRTSNKVVEVASFARPLPYFEYVPTTGYEPSHRHAPVMSQRHSEGMKEAPHANKNGRSQKENRDRSIRADALYSHRPSHGLLTKSTAIDQLLKRDSRFLREEHELAQPEPREKGHWTLRFSSWALPSGAPASSSSGPGVAALPSRGIVSSSPTPSSTAVKLHQLRVLTLGLGRTAILNVLNVRLKITLYAEGLRCQEMDGLDLSHVQCSGKGLEKTQHIQAKEGQL
ncbi:LOW QUALITY PROTEIN: hypothetical protein Cgig2_017953 [Carnegiea gigantea]|uniref:Uncharacterized protein n=1 Tax=Carnegiea gigantea TaxID=171969 RepID=A0A9Q1GSM7_9CARY|nr:LOW QUALITY PROTEIN: hypothetical protein Cgig2_025456 [Carnegiea gigantea]KAJ8438615.1 LOW QUALITY PROTEIN: hypothetical protein Cgig2_017953 [Carnegiea gigantea]